MLLLYVIPCMLSSCSNKQEEAAQAQYLAGREPDIQRPPDGAATQAWWEGLVNMEVYGEMALTEKETQALAELAYIASGRPMVSMEEMQKEEMLFRAYIYYSLDTNYAYIDGKYTASSTKAYPADEVRGEYAKVAPEQLNRLINGMYGVDVPDLYAPYALDDVQEGDWADYYCDGEWYWFFIGDYIDVAFYVEACKPLGEGLYYVVFGRDWMSTPALTYDPGIEEDMLHMVVEKSESQWGFTICAVIKYVGETALQDGWPEMKGVIPVENGVSSYPSGRTAKERKEDIGPYQAYLKER